MKESISSSTHLEYNNFATLLLNKQGNILALNSKLADLLNLSIDDVINKPILDIFELQTIANEPELYTLPLNSQVFANLIIHDEDKTPVQLLTSDLDAKRQLTVIITKNENFDNRIYNTLNQLNLAVEGANIGIWQYDIASGEVFFSAKFRELINVTKDNEMLSWQAFIDLCNPDDSTIFNVHFKNHIEHEIPLDFEFRMNINNKIKWFIIKGNIFKHQQKKHRVLGTLIDITASKDTLHKLNQLIINKKIAMEAGKIGSWHAVLAENNHSWQWSWDEATNKMFALSQDDMGQLSKWEDRLHPEDRARVIGAMKNSLQTGVEFNQEYRAILPNGDIKYFAGKGKVGHDADGQSYRIDGVIIDHSEIKEAQIQLEVLNDELEANVAKRTKELQKSMERATQASQIKSDFLSMMSHELRTPMNAVIGSLDLLATTEQSAESMDLIDTAKTSAENLVFILNDILDISKIEAGKLLLEDRPFSLSEVINNIAKVFEPSAQKQNVLFKIHEDANIPMYVKGDSMRVRQILFNIIGNALKFTQSDKERQGEIELIALVVERNPYVCTVSVKVIDNGIGISQAQQQKLFTPFTQAERSTTRKFGGTGLGLAICGQLTEMMGGRITLTSELGEGSCFDIELPFWLSQETSALDVEELSAMNICLLNTSSQLLSKQETFSQYLKQEGAMVTDIDFTKVQLKDNNLKNMLDNKNFDVYLILVDKIINSSAAIKELKAYLNKNKQILLLVHSQDLATTKAQFKRVRISNIDTITKVQLIKLIKQTKEASCKFDFGELDLSELDLNENTSSEKTDELDLSLDDLALDDLKLENLELNDLTPENLAKNSRSAHSCKLSATSQNLKQGILVVEDNQLNQKLIKQQLTKLGYNCDLANDGEEGQKVWQAGNYKMILTDCHMPIMDGYQMSESIRKVEQANNTVKPIPIIAVTGAAMSGDDEKCFQAGMSDFVSKPVQLADLKKTLTKWYPND